jgi:hypothetical protein
MASISATAARFMKTGYGVARRAPRTSGRCRGLDDPALDLAEVHVVDRGERAQVLPAGRASVRNANFSIS